MRGWGLGTRGWGLLPFALGLSIWILQEDGMLATQVEATPRFIITLNASASPQGAIRVPLAITGKWVRGAATFAITRQDLESIVHNFRERQNGEINVDYDHASEMPEVAAGGPVPSAGRIVRLDAPKQMKNGSGKLEIGNGEKEPDFPLPTSYSRFLLYGWYEPTSRARSSCRTASTVSSRPPSSGAPRTSARANRRAPRSLPWRLPTGPSWKNCRRFGCRIRDSSR